MNAARRKLILSFSIFLGVMIAAFTAIFAYLTYRERTLRFGDIFDRVAAEQAQVWVAPALITITGISAAGILIFIGLFIFRNRE